MRPLVYSGLFSTDTYVSMQYRTTTFTDGSDLIEIKVHPEIPVNEAIEDRHHSFIGNNWPSLGAACFDGYKRFGIGAVVVKGQPIQSHDDRPFAPRELFYATDIGSWLSDTLNDPLAGAVDKALQTYDPNETGLLLFIEDNDRPRMYTVDATLTPPQAFQRVRALMN